MAWLANIVLFVIGVLCIVMPLVLKWPANTTAGAFGLAAAALYAAIRMLATNVKPGSTGAKVGITAIGRFVKWYDGLVMIGLIVAGIVIGLFL